MPKKPAAKPAPAILSRWRDHLIDGAVLAIPTAIVAKFSGWLQSRFFDAPWQILWIALPLAFAAWISWRVLRRPEARRAQWSFIVFLGIYCSVFAIASATDLLVWKRMPTGYETGAASGRMWLVPLAFGDWRYWLIDPAMSDKARFAVVLLEHPAGATRERLRINDRRVIEVAKRGKALGLAFDIAYEGSSDSDNLFCSSLAGFTGPVVLPFAYKRSPDGNDFVRATTDPPATLPCLANRPSGHAMALAEADNRVRSVPLYWEDDQNRPALSLVAAKSIIGDKLSVPEDRLLRFVPATDLALKVYKTLDSLLQDPSHIEGRFVFIGENSKADTFDTPFGPMAGAQIHALAANSLLAGKVITRPSGGVSAVVVFASCYLLLLFGSQGYSTRALIVVAVTTTVAIFALAAAAIHFLLVWLDVVYAVAALWLLLPLLLVFRRFVQATPS